MNNKNNNQKNKLTTLDIVRYIIFGICLIPEFVILVAISCYDAYLFGNEGQFLHSDYVIAVAITVITAFFLAVTIISLIKTKQRFKGAIVTSISYKLGLFIILMGAVESTEDVARSVPVTFAVIGAFSIFIALLCDISVLRNSSNEKKKKLVAKARPKHFDGYDIDRLYKRAEEEYLYLNNLNRENLEEEDRIRIYDYAANEMTYFLTWLIRKDYISSKLRRKLGSEVINGFQEESQNPTIIMRNVIDYKLRFKDISDNINFFADAYLTLPDFKRDMCSSKFMERYIFDYYRNVIRKNENGIPIKYCHTFSWDIYNKLERVIDERFRNLCAVISEGRSNPSYEKGSIYSSVYNMDIKVTAKRDVPDDYIERCKATFDDYSFRINDELVQMVYKLVKKDVPSLEYVRDNLRPSNIDIFVPMEEDEAYIVYGRLQLPDKEPADHSGDESGSAVEHFPMILSWVVRKGVLLNVDALGGYILPWDFEADVIYKKKVAEKRLADALARYKYSGHQSINEEIVNDLVRDGVVVKDQLVTRGFSDYQVCEIYIPEEIKKIKDYYVSMAEALICEGLADYYICKPEYTNNSLIPTKIRVEARKMDVYEKLVFLDKVGIAVRDI
ncbi:MAG: hypothetical protein IJ749_05240 [Eubacterium sp.]|nr:hypothetical protein [Eubacterium sp.]